MRIFLDSNVLISAVATRGLSYDVLRIVLARHQLVLGETVLVEVPRVLLEKLSVAPEVVRAYEELLRREAVIVSEGRDLGIVVRDPDDAIVLGEAVAADADILVTGDQDLLAVADEAPLQVLTPRELWELLRDQD